MSKKSKQSNPTGKLKSSATTRSTAGGGFGFEDQTAAFLLVKMLSGEQLPGFGDEGLGSLLHMQTSSLGWLVDDLLAVTPRFRSTTKLTHFPQPRYSENASAADVLLDALCLDPNAEVFLGERVDLLLGDNGRLLTRLLRRFLHVASVPGGPSKLLCALTRSRLRTTRLLTARSTSTRGCSFESSSHRVVGLCPLPKMRDESRLQLELESLPECGSKTLDSPRTG
jgi:hypothetical protein